MKSTASQQKNEPGMTVKEDHEKNIYLVGVDVGSTTTKLAVVDLDSEELVFCDYRRHHAHQLESVRDAIGLFRANFPGACMRLALTGSGAKTLSEKASIHYIQEVVANSIALRKNYETVGTAIELGGQDAKIIFFGQENACSPWRLDAHPLPGHPDASGETSSLKVRDMRMNGACAGGTGAFIDEVARLLMTSPEDFDALAAEGTTVYEISGRCGVYAKTDIQPLLNQGAEKSDIALSAFHAIAKQTIGGLAQGITIESPVVLEGGPLTFNKTLRNVFRERLSLSEEEILVPSRPEIMMAYGAALSLKTLFRDDMSGHDPAEYLVTLTRILQSKDLYKGERSLLYFADEAEREAFLERHKKRPPKEKEYEPGTVLPVWLGIDSGSTTTKFVLLSEDEEVVDYFYAPNEGDPLIVAKDALIAMRDRFREKGVKPDILGACSTGYGELLFHKAFSTDCHVVETVAHFRAALKFTENPSFILDIGGQDMKAIWVEDGVITNIVVNEACSSGCGSFLENFASTLGIAVEDIAKEAFDSENPAELGSRCTVFMTSSIVTEQRNGKLPKDIMAGLCRSIIENVFTKVIRMSNLASLGDRIVVQGGTFENDAVLRALEQYVGKEVVRAPYPGIMGAIGAALTAKEEMGGRCLDAHPLPGHSEVPGHLNASGETGEVCSEVGVSTPKSSFIDLSALEDFAYFNETGVPCPFCGNHCRRSVVRFRNGSSSVSGNRCERGEILGDIADEATKLQLARIEKKKKSVTNLYKLREKLLFRDYEAIQTASDRGITIGIPRVLAFWDYEPFWNAFFRSLGFGIVLSDMSSHALYESGLNAVCSDTECFPAKLVHGHLRNLAAKKVTRIFMPSIAAFESENTEKTSEYMCALVKGFPLVVKNSDDPMRQWQIPFDSPLFYWYSETDKRRQICDFMRETFGIGEKETLPAIEMGEKALSKFRSDLTEAGAAALSKAQRNGEFLVVLASRPYHNDSLVNHGLPELFGELGVGVVPADALPGLSKVNLSESRLDVVNNYHGRMLASAIFAAESPFLEYAQIVSFGCGHDAYLSDEITRLMKEISGKSPLVLKLDESEIAGPLRIRVRSFVETVRMRRRSGSFKVAPLPEPYPVKFASADRKTKTVLVPNTSHAFCRIMSAAMARQGIRAVPLGIGRERAIYLGKKYVHNDICFPAQIVIGEALEALIDGHFDPATTAIAMGKYACDCRLAHYGALTRKALDDAGFPEVPILTNDDIDYHDLHPGYKLDLLSSLRIAFALPMIDVLEELLRKIRPYELSKGDADSAFQKSMDMLVEGLSSHGIRGLKAAFEKAVDTMDAVPHDRSRLRPTVLIVGEYLLNFHPGANHDIEDYLENNGLEIIEARMTDVIRKTYFAQDEQIRTYGLHRGFGTASWMHLANVSFEAAHEMTDRIASRSPLYERALRLPELVRESEPIIPHTFDAGEGVLIPGEILYNAARGCRAFVILQPFGCLPNHIVGRGIAKKLKEIYPDCEILPLDYDPDVSFANIENRLQMLIMNVRERERESEYRKK